jgi:hypothetical protein
MDGMTFAGDSRSRASSAKLRIYRRFFVGECARFAFAQPPQPEIAYVQGVFPREPKV